MNALTNKHAIGHGETVALLALMISLVALSIDTILPALGEIGRDLGVAKANDNQFMISMLIFGMATGQMLYGPLSDSIGRKPAIYLGLGVYIAGSLIAAVATSYFIMLTGRVLQGLGAAGPRVVTLALVRDQYEGWAMARVMSIVMSIFIFVPVVAPSLGQGILLVAHWRTIFWVLIALALVASTWFALRQPETLAPRRRIPFTAGRIAAGIREVCATRVALGYTIAAGFVFGAFFGYLNSAQQLFQQLYNLGTRFPLVFGVLALAIGGALIFNSRLVVRFGMQQLTQRAICVISALSALAFAIAWAMGGILPLWSLMAYLMISFFSIGILFGNLNAIAMQPLGHIAGVGAAVVGSISTFISVPLGIAIGQCYNDTVLPLTGGFALFGLLSLVAMRWAENGKPAACCEVRS